MSASVSVVCSALGFLNLLETTFRPSLASIFRVPHQILINMIIDHVNALLV